mmetsp:Transcript_5988/g.14182  ORF Transcript_5988/g.14182 Transcript_5988/m.14182 type:complete len:212 (-) Transcript_5988:890-1525(-)
MVRKQGSDDGMSCLVVCNKLLGRVVLQCTSLEAGDDAVGGIVDLIHADRLLVATCREDGRLVHEILQVGTRKARSALGNVHEGDLTVQLLVLDVNFQNLCPAFDIWEADLHTAVKAAGAQQSIVQDVRPVSGSNDDDATVALEAVHFREDLVQSLLTLVVATAHAGPTLTTNSIDLVNEHDAGRFLLRLLENVPHARSTHTDEELDELRGR